ncbi:MAG: hypothetical protein H6855_00985 [Rhodospirillales bacterium]|nr:hypothetical protein [Rhodospirillales bacterium]MCB9964643.1 hypothetical protein [Rhodospirillales bacterium]
MNDIFRDVDEALKQEKVAQFWQKHGTFVIILVILLVLGTGLYSGYKSWMKTDQEHKTARLLEITKETAPDFDTLLANLNPDQKAVGLLLETQRLLEEDGREVEAFDTLQTLAADSSADQTLRGLAAYYARNLIIDGKITTTPLSAIQGPAGSIWDGYYQLQDATYQGAVEKNYKEAISLLDKILEAYPQDMVLKEQAAQLKYVYEYDQKQGN